MDYEQFIGAKFGRLTISNIMHVRNSRYEMLVECACSCGGSWSGPFPRLMRGNTKSCGCLQPDVASQCANKNHTHSDSKSPTYKTHRAMMRRCYDKNNISYPLYGARGVSVCDRWRGVENYPNFKADMGERPVGKTLDRYPNSSGNYEPGNCRWATPAEQARNFSTNHWITANGETLVVTDWARRIGVTPTTILDRIKRGRSEEEAVTMPKDVRNAPTTDVVDGEVLTIKQAAEKYQMDPRLIRTRMSQGHTMASAVAVPSRGVGNKGKRVDVNGVSMSFTELSQMAGVPYAVVLDRYKRGWSIDRIINTPVQMKTRREA